jgi:hypothetical protein
MKELMERHGLFENDLTTFDPYDIWKTNIGFNVKNLFNQSRILGAMPALLLTLYDFLLNNQLRIGYKKQEYPIVRSLAAQILLNEFQKSQENSLLISAKQHLNWLVNNISVGFSGACWGLGFKWAAHKNIIYDENTPHTTHTPYALEAFHLYTQISGDQEYANVIKSCFKYYENDVCVMFEDDNNLAVSYGPFKDKTVINATSYTLFAYSIFLEYFPEKREYIISKMLKLFSFLQKSQQKNGSWYYSTDEKSFIDCFHSCIIIKNLLKANSILKSEAVETTVHKGYQFVSDNLFNTKSMLYKRFYVNNKVSLSKFDLYDNAEMLNLANLLNDQKRVKEINAAINKYFILKNNIYSTIDFLGFKRNKNTLRWAVMPYLYALSKLN